MKCLQDLENEVRDLIDEPSADSEEWPSDGSVIITHLNNELTKRLATRIRSRDEDFFGVNFVIPLVTGQYDYVIPRGAIRSVEILKSGVTDSGNGVYTVAYNANRIKLDRIEFHEKDEYLYQPQLNAITGVSGYYQWGSVLRIADGTSDIKTGYYLRVFMLRSLVGLHYGTMVSATTNTLVINTATKGELPKTSNSYLGYGVNIYSGTGIGQERQIIGHSYNPTTGYHTLTLDSVWGTLPSGAVVYSITPPIEPEFEEALVFGAALRCKFKVEDPQSELYQWYKQSLDDALNMITPRSRDGVRRVNRKATY
jgi:hypothetical protein